MIAITASLPAITLWQPWASLVAIGAKPFETRGYPPPKHHLGKRIAIHAAMRPVDIGSLCPEIRSAFQERFPNRPMIAGPDGVMGAGMPYGAVVCTAILTAAHECGAMNPGNMVYVEQTLSRSGDGPLLIEADSFGDFSPGRWAWQLDDIEIFTMPIPARGRQGWWTWWPAQPNSALQTQRLASAPGGSPAFIQG